MESVSHPVTHIVDMSQWHRLRADHGGNGLVGFFHGIYTDPKILKQYQRFLEVAYLRLVADGSVVTRYYVDIHFLIRIRLQSFCAW